MFYLIVCSSADLKWLKHNLSSMTANVTLCHVFIYFTKTKSKCKKTSTPDSVALETPLTAIIRGFLCDSSYIIHLCISNYSFVPPRPWFMWSVWVPKHGALCYGQMTLVSHWGLTVVVCSNFYCAAMFLERRVVSLFTSLFLLLFLDISPRMVQSELRMNFVRRMNIFL